MENIVRAICQQEGIPVGNIQVLSGGQVNAVYLIDGQYVIRIGAREDAFQRLKRETELIRSLAGEIPVPKILSFGQQEGFVYQIQAYIPGQKLYWVWKNLTLDEQEKIGAELAGYLKILHGRRFPNFGPVGEDAGSFDSWSNYLSVKFNQAIEEIHALNIRMVPGFLELAVEYFEEHRHALEDGVPGLVHGDLSLVNVLVDKGRVSAIIDFEYALRAPKDYELYVMEAFCLYPKDWAEEDHEVFCSADFARFIPLIQKYDPELFDSPHLRERVNLYHLAGTLNSYLGWRKDNLGTIPPEKMAAKEFYMARITNFIFRHGARMF